MLGTVLEEESLPQLPSIGEEMKSHSTIMTGNKYYEENYEAGKGDKNECGDEGADSTG